MDGAAADATGSCSGVGYAFLCRDSTIPKQFEFFAEQSDQRSSASNSDATRQYSSELDTALAVPSLGWLSLLQVDFVDLCRDSAMSESELSTLRSLLHRLLECGGARDGGASASAFDEG